MAMKLFRRITITEEQVTNPRRTKPTTVIQWKFSFLNSTFSSVLTDEHINIDPSKQIILFQEMINTMKCIQEGRIKEIITRERE